MRIATTAAAWALLGFIGLSLSSQAGSHKRLGEKQSPLVSVGDENHPPIVEKSAPPIELKLSDRFIKPSSSAQPRVWWHWMDGNVTREGINKDLSWMKRVGIAGVQNFDGSLHTPQIVHDRVAFLSEAWRSAMQDAVSQAKARDLEFAIASSPGWSETGGPWVRPEQGMKKLVWSEFDVRGGRRLAIKLPMPPRTSGPFQDITGGGADPTEMPPANLPMFYRDDRVIAYRLASSGPKQTAAITSSSPIDPRQLTTGSRSHFQDIRMGQDKRGWIDFAFANPVTMRAVELVLQPGPRVGPIYPSWPSGWIETSVDGQRYIKIADLPSRGAPQQTIAFAATTARHFRLVLENRFAPFAIARFAPPATPVTAHRVARVKFLEEPRVHRFEDKTGWSTISGLDHLVTPDISQAAVLSTGNVIDITQNMKPDGTLRWNAPSGHWRILRMGFSLTGKLNNPASLEGTGLEVDKLNRVHVKAYLDTYLRYFEEATGRANLGSGGIQYMLNDSYEAMAANWTDDILEEFEKRRGYDPTPWLPVLTGRVVEGAQESDRFLWDFRRTLADLIADEHYGLLSDELHTRKMGRYGESHEALRAFVGDGMEVKKSADIPMGASWAMPNTQKLLPDLLESASVAHLYGQNVVAAESFTSFITPYGYDPARLKPYADKMMANGVNRFVIHTSAHQPLERLGPGVTLGGAGQFFTRKETWAEMARPWIDYLGRSSELLQQGRSVADIAWFYGEDDNITALYDEQPPKIPAGYSFDFVNADAIRSLLQMQGASLNAPGGASYRILAIDPNLRRMTLGTLLKLDELSRKGLIIAGPKPIRSPSLADNQSTFSAVSESIWSRSDRVFPDIETALAALEVPPDAVISDPRLAFVHRKLNNGDIYYLANLGEGEVKTTASFRVSGKAAEIWRADDLSMKTASYRIADGRTLVPLDLAANDALFVVFRKPATSPSYTAPKVDIRIVQTVDGPWQLDFPPDRGAPPIVHLDQLRSWSESDIAGVRYFSGTARYTKQIQLRSRLRQSKLMIDLGAVGNVAEVFVNGQSAGIAWKEPYRVDITPFATEGTNTIEIAVANLWPNRIIGDLQTDNPHRFANADYNPFDKHSPLLPSGLLGPVRIVAITSVREARIGLKRQPRSVQPTKAATAAPNGPNSIPMAVPARCLNWFAIQRDHWAWPSPSWHCRSTKGTSERDRLA